MHGIPKSSLDAARESVIGLRRKERDPKHYRTPLRKLRLGPGEELDALGVAKRLAGDPDQFTAYSRVAADPWIEALSPEQQDAIGSVYGCLVKPEHDLATKVSGNGNIYSAVPYDAQLLYDFRLANAQAAADLTGEDKDALDALKSVIKTIGGQATPSGDPVGAPVPYGVILKADGDHMGTLLSRAATSGNGLVPQRRNLINNMRSVV